MPFKIHNITTGKILREVYENGNDAAEKARYLAKRYGMVYQPRPVMDENWWRKEERDYRAHFDFYNWGMARGYDYYRKFYNERDRDNRIRNTYPRPSNTPHMIDYYESPEKGMRGILTTTTMGRYLTEYYDKTFTKEEIRDISTEWEARSGPIELKFTTNGDEIEACYRFGPNTCAAFRNHPAHKTHPSRVYDGGDLQIAYLGSIEAKRITARAIVWPAKKITTPGYGDMVRIDKALADAGWTKFQPLKGHVNPFIGARLRKIVEDDKYIGGHVDYFPFFQDMGDHLLVVKQTDDWDANFCDVRGYAIDKSHRPAVVKFMSLDPLRQAA